MAIITLNNNSLVNADVGKVLQVVTTTNTTNAFTSNSTSEVDIEFNSVVFELSITPSSASSKIYVMANVPVRTAHNTIANGRYGISLHSKIGAGSYSTIWLNSTNSSWLGSYDYGNSGSQVGIILPLHYLHSPNSTDEIKYKLKIKVGDSTNTVTVNRDQAGTQITAMEIQG